VKPKTIVLLELVRLAGLATAQESTLATPPTALSPRSHLETTETSLGTVDCAQGYQLGRPRPVTELLPMPQAEPTLPPQTTGHGTSLAH
jgi:hypothetical protein